MGELDPSESMAFGMMNTTKRHKIFGYIVPARPLGSDMGRVAWGPAADEAFHFMIGIE